MQGAVLRTCGIYNPLVRKKEVTVPGTRVTAARGRPSFSEIIHRAANGKERIIIERGGKRVAAVVPIEDLDLLEAMEDRIDLEEAHRRMKEEGAVPWSKVRKELGL